MALTPFRNEPLTDFSQPAAREAFESALAQLEAGMPYSRELVIGGESVTTDATLVSVNPSNHGQVVARVAQAGTAEAERAVEAAERAFPSWSSVPVVERARVLLRTATLLRARRHELSATMVLEVGKNWVEADADTAEAIDFLEYYAREAIRLEQPGELTTVSGTDNELRYIPLGVGLAISPWNFPLAIAMGLVSSAIAAGNTLVFKPSSLTPLIGARIVDLLTEAGLPAGVVNYVPGPGGTVGDYLVGHPRVRFINFTGSREVGVHINEVAARVGPGQRWLKRVIAEMGGKDAIVVDSTADLELAATAIVSSAYGFQGQKCSACSRVIADETVYDDLLGRVTPRIQALRVGPATTFGMDLGPVADRAQFDKIAGYLEVGRREGRLVVGGEADDRVGYFVYPTLFVDVDPEARIMQEEIFGPVLAMTRARDFDHALDVANNTVYGLTGGVFARDPDKLARARRELHVGNLYINRKITGALVGVEPFGGFNLSGTNAKAGGPDYLKLLSQAKAISERL